MNTNNELKPGDRVRLTGWNEDEMYRQREEAGLIPRLSFPFSTKIIVDLDGNMVVAPRGHGYWHITWFTYEKITDDGNG